MTIKDCITCRTVLWWMVFTGTATNFMLRATLNIVLIAIVVPPSQNLIQGQCNGVAGNSSLINMSLDVILGNENDSATEKQVPTHLFPWSEYEQGLASGAYYWIHMLSEIPGGVLARKYGTKLIFGIGNLLPVLLGLFIPIAIKYDLYALITIRVIQGFIAGTVFPATHDLTSKWIPKNERSTFVSAYLGGGFGIGVTYPICAFIIHFWGWEAVFYVFTAIGVIWFIAWHLLVFDSPSQHPRISEHERTYLESELGEALDHSGLNDSIPWKHILTSIPVWMTILANYSIMWGYFTLLVEAPAYLTFVHGWSLNQAGVLSGIPHIISVGFGCIFAQYCDWLLRSKKMVLTNVRRLAMFCSTCIPALMIFGLSLSGCYPILAVCFMLIGVTSLGAISSGPMANFVDLSPNCASILLGASGLIGDMSGFLSPLIIGLMINENQTLQQWRLVLIMTASIMAAGFIFHFIWGTADEQSWNSYRTVAVNVNDKEMGEIGVEKMESQGKTPLTQ